MRGLVHANSCPVIVLKLSPSCPRPPAWCCRRARAASACPPRRSRALGGGAPAPAGAPAACQRWRQSPRRWRCTHGGMASRAGWSAGGKAHGEQDRWRASKLSRWQSSGTSPINTGRQLRPNRPPQALPHRLQHPADGVGHHAQQALAHALDGACRWAGRHSKQRNVRSTFCCVAWAACV